MQRLRKFFKRSSAERLLLLHAVALHAAVRAGCRHLSYPLLVRTLERLYPLNRRRLDQASVGRIAWAVQTAAFLRERDHLCLPAALTAQSLLRSHGVESVVRFGVAVDHRDRFAHAWLECDGTPVFGYQPGRFVPLERSA